MNDEQKAAYLNSQVACALIEMAAMKAANSFREMQGYTIAYGEEAFHELITKYGIHHNAAMTLFHGDITGL
jgi:hypothetical protein